MGSSRCPSECARCELVATVPLRPSGSASFSACRWSTWSRFWASSGSRTFRGPPCDIQSWCVSLGAGLPAPRIYQVIDFVNIRALTMKSTCRRHITCAVLRRRSIGARAGPVSERLLLDGAHGDDRRHTADGLLPPLVHVQVRCWNAWHGKRSRVSRLDHARLLFSALRTEPALTHSRCLSTTLSRVSQFVPRCSAHGARCWR